MKSMAASSSSAPKPDLWLNQCRDFGPEGVCGIDEAGRGPLAGPVVTAAVVLDASRPIAGLHDSKKLMEARREMLYKLIIQQAAAYSIQCIEPAVIDEMNILQATLYGMELAAREVADTCTHILIDGNRVPKALPQARAIVKGDGRYAAIAAASILAKVTRDRIMREYHQQYPHYNFAQNKGYPTAQHLQAIQQHGITPIHRKSYKPIHQLTLDF
jgi:ribonuclease HII